MFRMKSIKKSISSLSNSKDGFTLIEIIAVLVILGILAAVAIPRFTNLQDEARNKAALAAISEGKARASQIYALQLLVANGDTSNVNASTVNTVLDENTNYGDFNVSLAQTGTKITITVDNVQGVPITGVAGIWEEPIQ